MEEKKLRHGAELLEAFDTLCELDANLKDVGDRTLTLSYWLNLGKGNDMNKIIQLPTFVNDKIRETIHEALEQVRTELEEL